MPQLQETYVRLQRQLQQQYQAGEFEQAEMTGQALVKLAPDDAAAHYNLACVQARQAKKEQALASLDQAVECGFSSAQHIQQNDDFAALRDEPKFKDIMEKVARYTGDPTLRKRPQAKQVESAAIENGVALVSAKNTTWDVRNAIFHVLFKFEEKPSQPIVKNFGEAGKLLQKWYAEGTAAGNHGDLYDNHDSDHSNMDYEHFPQLARVEFADEAKAKGLHHGLQAHFFYNAVTLGNSSTALVNGPFWRSQPRLALTNARGINVLAAQYANNHLYVYPEHRDHDVGHNGKNGRGYGDVYACNTPYVIISQGSSGSDRVFLNAVAATLAAFRPEVKKRLVETRALMPAVQMILRASYKTVAAPEDYLSGKAHPTVFDGEQLDVVRMVTLAHEITLETLPPVVQIQSVEEDQPVLGRDYFDVGPRERLLDTPAAIARVCKSSQYWRRMVVSAEGSRDPNGQPLKYQFVVLRGDAEGIQIRPLNEDGSVTEIRVPYHPRRPVAPGAAIESNRVDIGVFVHNGARYSAPAFVSFYFLDNEKRIYDDRHRILVVDYTAPEVKDNYVDPVLDARKNWRDEYAYDAAGNLTGWTRIRGDQREDFNAMGELIVRRDDAGRPLETRPVRYVVRQDPNAAPTLEQEVLPPMHDPRPALLSAVKLYASFDEAVRADRARGSSTLSTRYTVDKETNTFRFEEGFPESVFRVAKGMGIHGGALQPHDVLPDHGRIFFPAKGNLAFRRGAAEGWGGAVSVWINTDPNKTLKTSFCDPIQITQKGANNGGIWFDFNNNKPRDMRMGVFPAVPEGQKGITEEDPQAPLVKIPGVDFREGEWHHVVLSWTHFDSGKPNARASLYVDGKLMGEIKDRAIAMDWDIDQTGIYVAVNYLGLLDELAVFGRALSAEEVALLHRQPGILSGEQEEKSSRPKGGAGH